MPKLFISAGHQGGETGTRGPQGQQEELITREIAELSAKDGIVLVPHLKLADRVKWINTNATEEDYLIELHLDSSDGLLEDDFGVYFYGGSQESQDKAADLVKLYTKITGISRCWIRPDTSSRFGRLGIIRDTKPMAFILELADIDISPERLAQLKPLIPQVLAAFGQRINTNEDSDKPSPWAAESWGKVHAYDTLRTAFERVKPQDEVTVGLVIDVLVGLGALKDIGDKFTAERLAVALDRLFYIKK